MWKFQAWNFQVWNFSTLHIWHNFNLICMLKFSRDHMWKFQGWNRCDSHVRIGVIDLVRDENTKTPPKSSITKRLRKDLGQSGGVTTTPNWCGSTGLRDPNLKFLLTTKAVLLKGRTFKSKIQVPRDVRNSKGPWQVQEGMISTSQQIQVPNGTGPDARMSKRPLLGSRTRCKCSMETSRN